MPKGDRVAKLEMFKTGFTPRTRAEMNTERDILNDLAERVPDLEAQVDKVGGAGAGTPLLFDECVNGAPGTVGLYIWQPPRAIA